MSQSVLILGGYGVFGGRLARRLIGEARVRVIVAGRSFNKAQHFCRQFGGDPIKLDRDQKDFAAAVAELSPSLVVDAAGPFQHYGTRDPYRVARAALACGAHYLDLSDDAAFTTGLSALDDDARAKRLVFLSGTSTLPAISSCVADQFVKGLVAVDLIESTILPDGRAPRGRSVVKAALAQAGESVRAFRSGRFTEIAGWSAPSRRDLCVDGETPILKRRASLIGAPDLRLFPGRYEAHSVLARAGLEPGIVQAGLDVLSRLRAWRLIPPLTPLAQPLRWMARQIEMFGNDRGGMLVRVVGRDKDRARVEKTWTLIVNGGDGPNIPAIAPYILTHKILGGHVAPGARACLGEFSMTELEEALKPFLARAQDGEYDAPCLFERVLGGDYTELPVALQSLHDVTDERIWCGKVQVDRGRGFVTSVIALLFGFPETTGSAPIEVTFHETEHGEIWTRRIGGRAFRSHFRMGRNPGQMIERFGLFSFDMVPEPASGGIVFLIVSGRFAGVPLPTFLLPRVTAREFASESGEACFDINVSSPLTGPVVHYRGTLRPLAREASQSHQPRIAAE